MTEQAVLLEDQIVIRTVKLEVHIVNIDTSMDDDALEVYWQQLGYKLVDWQLLAGLKRTRPNFASGHSVGTHWWENGKRGTGRWRHYAVDSKPNMNPSCFRDGVWVSGCWFAVVHM